MKPLPAELLAGPFTLERSRELAVSRRVLARHFRRVHPMVWRHRDYVLTEHDRVVAARLVMPARTHLTGISRIRALGLDYGADCPVRFVIEGDLHLAVEGVFLHRTKQLPPVDDIGVTPAAAFIFYCATARVIDAVKVGDWLLHRGHMTLRELRHLALAELWRPGSHEAIWVAEHLDGDARSLPESETRVLVTFAGLPTPDLNVPLDDGPDRQVIGDLVYRKFGLAVEYEGHQHQQDRGQYTFDIDRFAWMRREGIGYVQITHEKLGRPRRLVGEVYGELVRRGYDGPPPDFRNRWPLLFSSLSQVIGPRPDHPRRRR